MSVLIVNFCSDRAIMVEWWYIAYCVCMNSNTRAHTITPALVVCTLHCILQLDLVVAGWVVSQASPSHMEGSGAPA